MIDTDDSGFIDKEEMKIVFACGSNFRKDFEKFWLRLIDQADTNGDG